MTFTYASLFSGIGGFESALNRLGGRCVFASEIDKFARQAYEVLYGVEPAGDITKIDATEIPDHDVLTAGFPCVAFSVAGKRLGFDDTRGTLFFEVARIARVKQPKIVLLENVKGLIGHDRGKTLNTIAQTLCDIGYTIDFNVLNSKYFGVPQNRERIFIIGVRDDLITPEPWSPEGTNVLARGKRRVAELDGIKTFNFDWPPQEEVSVRLRDILESDVDEKYYLSNYKTMRLLERIDEDGIKVCGELEGGPWDKRYEAIRRVYEPDGVSPSITAGGGGGVEPKITEEVRPVTSPDYDHKTQNGRRIKDTDEPMFTLTAQDRHGVAIGQPTRYRIRKLTPRECWRLQNFTDEQHDAVAAAGISDSQRYKMAGNAVTVSVIEAIGERMLPLLGVEEAII